MRLAGAIPGPTAGWILPLAARCRPCAPFQDNRTGPLINKSAHLPPRLEQLRGGTCKAVEEVARKASTGQGSSSTILKSAAERFVDTLGAENISEALVTRIANLQAQLRHAHSEV